MTYIKFRFGPRDIKRVDVREPKCPTYGCFYPSRHTSYSAAGYSGCSSRTTDEWECGTRERQGCPPPDAKCYAQASDYKKRGGAWEGADHDEA